MLQLHLSVSADQEPGFYVDLNELNLSEKILLNDSGDSGNRNLWSSQLRESGNITMTD